jgi:hypothetical protein
LRTRNTRGSPTLTDARMMIFASSKKRLCGASQPLAKTRNRDCEYSRRVLARGRTGLFHDRRNLALVAEDVRLQHGEARAEKERLALSDADHEPARGAEAGIAPSVGSRGNSYDNALAESV